MKNKFLMILLSCVLFSCSNEDNFMTTDQVGGQTPKVLDESIPVVGSFKELYELSGIRAEVQEPVNSSMLSARDLAYCTETGYTRITETRSQKAMFTTDFANKMGLQPYTVYIYNWMFVEKDVNTDGRMVFIDKSTECGMTPIIDDTYHEVTDWNNRGYKVLSTNNPAVFKTHIFFVEYDSSGKRLDKYLPTSPSNLKWNYILF